jgi:hypothetical protein
VLSAEGPINPAFGIRHSIALLSLSLLVLRNFADDADHALTPDDLALRTDFLD